MKPFARTNGTMVTHQHGLSEQGVPPSLFGLLFATKGQISRRHHGFFVPKFSLSQLGPTCFVDAPTPANESQLEEREKALSVTFVPGVRTIFLHLPNPTKPLLSLALLSANTCCSFTVHYCVRSTRQDKKKQELFCPADFPRKIKFKQCIVTCRRQPFFALWS